MSQKATHTAQVIHRTCAGCGHVAHYDGSQLNPEQLVVLRSLNCEECGHPEAVIMMTEHEPRVRLSLAPLPTP